MTVLIIPVIIIMTKQATLNKCLLPSPVEGLGCVQLER